MQTDRDNQANPIDAFVLDRIRFRVDDLIGEYGFTESDREDLQQELILGVLEAMQNNFDPDRSSRETFIRNVLDRRCVDIIRYQQAQGRDACRNGFSLDEGAGEQEQQESAERRRRGDDAISPIERADVRMDVEALASQLPERQRRVCLMLGQYSAQAIAKELGVCSRTIYRDIQRIRAIAHGDEKPINISARCHKEPALTKKADSEPTHLPDGATMTSTPATRSILDCLIREPAETYHAKAKENLSSHRLADFRRCPRLYRRRQLGLIKDKDTASLLVGRATHTLVLEGRARFDAEYVVGGPINERTGKQYGTNTKTFAEWVAAQQRSVLTDGQAVQVEQMAASVADHDEAQVLLGSGVAEGVVRVIHCDLACQIRIDWLNPEFGIVDLKTCDDLDCFEADARKYRYVHQLAFYRSILAAGAELAVTEVPVHLIAAEKYEPFRVGVWRVGQDVLAIGQQDNERAIQRLKQCMTDDHWPTGYEQVRVFDYL